MLLLYVSFSHSWCAYACTMVTRSPYYLVLVLALMHYSAYQFLIDQESKAPKVYVLRATSPVVAHKPVCPIRAASASGNNSIARPRSHPAHNHPTSPRLH